MRTSILIFALLAPLIGSAQEVTEPYGFNTITCPANSDTIVGVPFRPTGSRKGTLNALPTVNGTISATLSIAGTPGFTVNGFANTWYAKFSSGTKNGRFYTITANDASTLTIDLNGDDMAGVLATDTVVIAQYWTLDSLFPPAGATTAWDASNVPNGHAIVASLGNLAFQRRTDVLFPNLEAAGTGAPANVITFIAGSQWRQSVSGFPSVGTKIIPPDSYIIIRHPSAVTKATKYKSTGEVETKSMSIPLSTLSTGKQDNYVALVRPLDMKLTQLGIYTGVGGPFEKSAGNLAFQRKDELLVFENDIQLAKKSPSAIYFHNGTNWIKSVSGFPISNDAVIPAGTGFIVRKAATASGATVFWINSPNY